MVAKEREREGDRKDSTAKSESVFPRERKSLSFGWPNYTFFAACAVLLLYQQCLSETKSDNAKGGERSISIYSISGRAQHFGRWREKDRESREEDSI